MKGYVGRYLTSRAWSTRWSLDQRQRSRLHALARPRRAWGGPRGRRSCFGFSSRKHDDVLSTALMALQPVAMCRRSLRIFGQSGSEEFRGPDAPRVVRLTRACRKCRPIESAPILGARMQEFEHRAVRWPAALRSRISLSLSSTARASSVNTSGGGTGHSRPRAIHHALLGGHVAARGLQSLRLRSASA